MVIMVFTHAVSSSVFYNYEWQADMLWVGITFYFTMMMGE